MSARFIARRDEGIGRAIKGIEDRERGKEDRDDRQMDGDTNRRGEVSAFEDRLEAKSPTCGTAVPLSGQKESHFWDSRWRAAYAVPTKFSVETGR